MEDRRLPSGVEPDHDDACLAGAEEGLDEPAEGDAHFGSPSLQIKPSCVYLALSRRSGLA